MSEIETKEKLERLEAYKEAFWPECCDYDISASVALVEKALPRLGRHWSLEDIESKLADDYLELGRFEDSLKIYLNWLRYAPAPVALIGEGGTPHSAQDSRIYEIVKKGLLKILHEVEVSGIVFEDIGDMFLGRTSPSFYGKLYLALARCYEEKGETKEAKEAHDKAMKYFGKPGE
jgi:tetratricopeptide (TPR) repeat protein